MNTSSSVHLDEQKVESPEARPVPGGTGRPETENDTPVHQHASVELLSDTVKALALPLEEPDAGEGVEFVCSPHSEANSAETPRMAPTGPTGSEGSPEEPKASEKSQSLSRREAPAGGDAEYSEIVLRIEKERTKQATLKCELARMVMELAKTADKTGMTPELLRRMFLEDRVDHRQHVSNMKARMQGAGRPAPGGLKPETPLPLLPTIPSSVTYGTLGCVSGASSTMGSQVSHSRSSSGRSLQPVAPNSMEGRADRSLRVDGSMEAPAVHESLEGGAGDRPLHMYTQRTFPFHFAHADPNAHTPAVTSTSPQMQAGAQGGPGAVGSGPTGTHVHHGPSGPTRGDDGLGLPYSSTKYPGPFQLLPSLRPSSQASPGSSTAHSPQMQVSGLAQMLQAHVPGHIKMGGGQPAAGLHTQMFSGGTIPPHPMHGAMVPAAAAGGHAPGARAPGAPQPVYYMNALSPLPAPMVPSQYYMPSNMVPWKLMPLATEKRRDEDESHVPKKAKTGKNNLNFMISTPKNPPARKYNK